MTTKKQLREERGYFQDLSRGLKSELREVKASRDEQKALIESVVAVLVTYLHGRLKIKEGASPGFDLSHISAISTKIQETPEAAS